MCTAVSFKRSNHYFGRNLDLEYSYNESVVITPRQYPFHFRQAGSMHDHFAIIGIATVDQGYPLYYDATNEQGLSMAGLNFPGNAYYPDLSKHQKNIAPFELIPWILSQCTTVAEALCCFDNIQIAAVPYSDMYPLTPLHWLLSDKHQSVTIEPTRNGLKIHENPFGILTNSPAFDFHAENVRQYLNLSKDETRNHFIPQLQLSAFSRGSGAFGLPGDNTSASRFVRAAFTKFNSVCEDGEYSCVSQFFHILRAVEQQKGCIEVNGKYEFTLYSSCCNTDLGVYYYTTYDNSQIHCVSMKNEDLDTNQIYEYPLIHTQRINMQN